MPLSISPPRPDSTAIPTSPHVPQLTLSAASPGTLPLEIRPDAGGFNAGTPIATGYWPRTGRGDPRVDGYSMTGIDLLFQWNFRRAR